MYSFRLFYVIDSSCQIVSKKKKKITCEFESVTNFVHIKISVNLIRKGETLEVVLVSFNSNKDKMGIINLDEC